MSASLVTGGKEGGAGKKEEKIKGRLGEGGMTVKKDRVALLFSCNKVSCRR